MQLFSVRNLSMSGLMMLLPMRMAFLHLRRKKDRQFWSFNTMGINQRSTQKHGQREGNRCPSGEGDEIPIMKPGKW